MFVDFENKWSPPPPPSPPEKAPRLSKRRELVLIWAICLFLLTIMLAPIGGGTLIAAAIAAFH